VLKTELINTTSHETFSWSTFFLGMSGNGSYILSHFHPDAKSKQSNRSEAFSKERSGWNAKLKNGPPYRYSKLYMHGELYLDGFLLGGLVTSCAVMHSKTRYSKKYRRNGTKRKKT
jgi:hypothetical protein